jgi:hypothetical protein
MLEVYPNLGKMAVKSMREPHMNERKEKKRVFV